MNEFTQNMQVKKKSFPYLAQDNCSTCFAQPRQLAVALECEAVRAKGALVATRRNPNRRRGAGHLRRPRRRRMP